MNIPLFFSLLLITSQQSSSNDIQQYYISGSNCTFFYQQSSQSEFIFINCQIQTQTTNDWNICLRKCCSSIQDQNSQISFSILQNCQASTSNISIGWIASLTIIGCVVLLCIICNIFRVGCHPCKCHYLCCCPVKRKEKMEKIYDWVEEKDVNTQSKDIKWSNLSCQRLKISNTNEFCCICLQKKTTTELVCGHHFHPNCLSSWFKKNKICPVCRHRNIRSVKVYCENCLWKYFVCDLNLLMENWLSLPQKCQKCGEKKGRKGSQEFINESRLHFNLQKTSVHSSQHEVQ